MRSAHEIIAGGPAAAGVRGNDLELGAGTTRLGNQVIELTGVTQRFGDHTVFSDVDLLIEPGARLAVVGPNGSGKTTLLDIIAGRKDPVAGVVDRGQTVVVGYADQHSSSLDPDAIVRKVVAGPYREPDHEDKALLEKFWFDSTAQFAPTRMLSGGERRRLQLVMVLATKPNLLILDEPTNDLDLDTLRSLEAFLDDWPGALVTSSHDRAFLDRVADHVLAIDEFGAMQRVPGGVSGWLAERAALTGKKLTGKKSIGQPSNSRQSDNKPPSGSAEPTAAGSNTGGGKPKAARTGPSASTIGRRLREAEQAMVKTQKRVDALADKLSGLAAVDELLAVGNQLGAAQVELDELEATWLELAEQSEG